MPKHLFIINPIAGGGKNTQLHIRVIKETMESHGLDYGIEITNRPRHAAEITASALDAGGKHIIYACGGDGTLNEVANGAYGRENAHITHYPCGTGNDFIKTFGNPDAFLELPRLIKGRPRKLDCIKLSNGRIALNICSVGVDANVAADMRGFLNFKVFGSKMPYNLSLVKNFLGGVYWPFGVDIDGVRMDDSFTILTACNGQTYGGGFNACPDADPSDQYLDFLLVRRIPKTKLAGLIKVYASGNYAQKPEYITHIRGNAMCITSKTPVNINYDGEIFRSESVSFTLADKKLSFIAPG